MIAAIYARKSTEQNGVDEKEKSVARQIEHATLYALRKGWSVADEHIYTDDGISGAEFAKRPGFLRLMNALKPKPAFQVLIMSEESRLGREAIETAYALKQIMTAGVRVWFYLEDRERVFDSPTDKLLLSVTAFADELEREKARQRTYDAMVRKAKALHVTGGRVFGYDNVDVPGVSANGDTSRSHVVRRINPTESAIVQRIFEMCAAGKGFTRIAKTLNGEGAIAPRPNPGRPRGWTPSSVREILYRSLYRGEIVWNQSQKRDRWGQKKQRPRPESEWIRVPAPELRIISDDLWKAAHARLTATRETYLRRTDGRVWGRPVSGIEAKYLLTGMAQCGCCGGTLHVRSCFGGKGRRLFYYGCSSYHLRGTTFCRNKANLPKEAADRAVLETIKEDLLRPEVIEGAITRAIEKLRATAGTHDERRQSLTAELHKIEAALTHLTEAIANGGDLPTLLQAMKDREQQRATLREELAALDAMPEAMPADLAKVQEQLRAYLAEWRKLLGKHVTQARQILRKLVDGKLVFTPKQDQDGKTYYEFRGQGTLGRLLEGASLLPKAWVSPRGYDCWWQGRWGS